jgi:hypothetical protein
VEFLDTVQVSSFDYAAVSSGMELLVVVVSPSGFVVSIACVEALVT